MAEDSIFLSEMDTIISEIDATIAGEVVAEPADYPEDTEEELAVVTGLLELTTPALQECVGLLNRCRKCYSDWSDSIKKIRDATEKSTALTEFVEFKASSHIDTKLANLKDRQKTIANLDSKLKVQEKKCAMKLRRAAPAATPATTKRKVRAAPPNIPIFYGDKTKYRNFIQLFRAVYDNSDMHPVEKFAALLDRLEGQPKKMLEVYDIEERNYAPALELLAKFYEDDEATSRALRQKLLDLKPATDDETVKTLLFEASSIISQLQAIGREVASEETIMQIERKLPIVYLEKLDDARKEVLKTPVSAAQPRANIWNLEKFAKSLGEIVIDQERRNEKAQQNQTAVKKQSTVEVSKIPQRPAKPQGPTMTFASVPPTKVTNKGAFKRRACGICDTDAHEIRDCPLKLSQRKEKVFADNKCFNCLKPGHRLTDCKSEYSCMKCKGRHHTALCSRLDNPHQSGRPAPRQNDYRQQQQQNWKQQAACIEVPSFEAPEVEQRPASTAISDNESNKVIGAASAPRRPRFQMMCVRAKVFNPHTMHHVQATIFVDTGSSDNYITEDLARRLGLPEGDTECLDIARFGDEDPSVTIRSPRHMFGITGMTGVSFTVIALQMKHILSELMVVNCSEEDLELLENGDNRCPPRRPEKPDILLGVECMNQLKFSYIREMNNGFGLFSSTLGPLICGSDREATHTSLAVSRKGFSSVVVRNAADIELENQMSNYLANESFGLQDASQTVEAHLAKVTAKFREELRYVTNDNPSDKEPPGWYEVKIPMKENAPKLPANLGLSKGRLESTLRRLLPDQQLYNEYDLTMKQQLDAGILEPVPKPWLSDGPVHYLPHQPVFKLSSNTTKMRIVFDASSGKPCLNDVLEDMKVYAGQNNKMISMIMARLRLEDHILTMDLAKAFLMMRVHPTNRDMMRILWPDGETVSRFSCVTFGLKNAPGMLGETLEYHKDHNPRPWTDKLMHGSYVDNFAIGVKEPAEIPQLAKDIRDYFWLAGFNCRQLASDCRAQIEQLPLDWRDERRKLSLLGTMWDTVTDELSQTLPKFEGVPTKRSILSTIGKFYDPVGWFAPIGLRAKLLQANVWKENVQWDKPIPPPLEQEWNDIMKTWENQTFILPRRAFDTSVTPETRFEIHAFSDACEKGLGLAVYIRRTDNFQTALVFGKSLVIPTSLQPKPKKDLEGNLKPREVSIPKLELHACFLLARAVRKLEQDLGIPIVSSQLWTDASTVLQWLSSGKVKDIFVGNRLQILREFFVRHVDGEKNPADLASRGLSPAELLSPDIWQLWTKGSSWLSRPSGEWPEAKFKFNPGDEVKSEQAPFFSVECATKATPAQSCNLKPLLDAERFVRWQKYRRATVIAIRAILHHGIKPLPTEHKLAGIQAVFKQKGPITPDELEIVEKFIIRETQCCFPADEATRRNLRLFTDAEGIIRCGGRLKLNELLADSTKWPIFLSKKAHVTKLILRDMHIRNHHCGPNTLISEFRQKYWTPQLRQQIRSFLYVNKSSKCLPCAYFTAKPFALPMEPPLPPERMDEAAAFTHVGVDLFGPFHAWVDGSSRKVYGCIFVCYDTRAIHIELVTDASTDKIMLAFRRYIGRRGVPKTILSDNAPQFRLAKNVIQKMWWHLRRDPIFLVYTSKLGIKMRSIAEFASWMGGHYERMNGNVKHCLRRVIGKKTLEIEELDTLFVEVERIVNLRPLTTIAEGDIVRPLRPIDFLQPMVEPFRISEPMADPSQNEDPDYVLADKRQADVYKLTRLYRKTMIKVEHFWRIWRTEYLLALRETWRVKNAKGVTRAPVMGEFVIINDEEMPRSVWKLAYIVEMTSQRTALVKVFPNGNILRRAICHLYPLELGEVPIRVEADPEDTEPGQPQPPMISDVPVENQTTARPKRSRPKKRDPNFVYSSDDEDSQDVVVSALRKSSHVMNNRWTKIYKLFLAILAIVVLFSTSTSGQIGREPTSFGPTEPQIVRRDLATSPIPTPRRDPPFVFSRAR